MLMGRAAEMDDAQIAERVFGLALLVRSVAYNVARTGVDSGGLQETGGDDRMAGT